jgi:hypothetical protein
LLKLLLLILFKLLLFLLFNVVIPLAQCCYSYFLMILFLTWCCYFCSSYFRRVRATRGYATPATRGTSPIYIYIICVKYGNIWIYVYVFVFCKYSCCLCPCAREGMSGSDGGLPNFTTCSLFPAKFWLAFVAEKGPDPLVLTKSITSRIRWVFFFKNFWVVFLVPMLCIG